MASHLPPPLICPTCRRPPNAWPLLAATRACTNPSCNAVHPVLDGTDVPVVVSDEQAAYLGEESGLRFDDESCVAAWLDELEPGSPAWDAAGRLGMYVDLHYRQEDTTFDELYQRFIEPISAPIEAALDLGCGVGGFASLLASKRHCTVTGLDGWPLALRWAAAASTDRRLFVPTMTSASKIAPVGLAPARDAPASPVRWVCGDAHHPPLPPGSFDLVTALNLFDAVADPALALGQASALLRPGGLLLMSQPDSWTAAATPPERWVGSGVSSWEALLDHYGLAIIDEDDGFEWTLERGPRTRFTYVSHARLVTRVET